MRTEGPRENQPIGRARFVVELDVNAHDELELRRAGPGDITAFATDQLQSL